MKFLQALATFFVNKPLHIAGIAALFLAGFLVLRFTAAGEGKHPGALLVPTLAWGVYALWEFLVTKKTPDADIRVDLLVLWPVLLILSVWFVIRAVR